MKMKAHQLDVTAGGKKVYLAPRFEILPLAMEYGIAVSSAVVRPPSGSGEIKTEWEVGTDRDVDLNW
ncbi:hypothetical protein [Sphingobacterium kitahiroshimense]|uniref:Uncharacterized protein n=1 Tax=Sphingobacterium kitahiroshimense TaxID=470446 RepID=A0ABV0BWF9_9SPHI